MVVDYDPNSSQAMARLRHYSELRRLTTFEERFDYLSLAGVAFDRTFGSSRWLNQMYYSSAAWRSVRQRVILRDNGCDLGIEGHEIRHGLLVHHMEPMTVEDVVNREPWIFDPEFLITTSHRTHNAIHYGDRSLLPRPVVARTPGDTKLW